MSLAFATLAPIADGGAAVITGGASGIGLAAAHRLAALGLPVVIADLAGERLQAAKAALAAAGARVLALPCDVTGSKQGITTPPGNAAYNVSKAALKAYAEALQYELRTTEGCRISAHLLIPGFTFTGITAARIKEKPPAAWTPEQVVEFLLEALTRGDFYVLCPDNDVTRVTDEKRMAWAMGDVIENRPALSRWHPDWTAAFEAYMDRPQG